MHIIDSIIDRERGKYAEESSGSGDETHWTVTNLKNGSAIKKHYISSRPYMKKKIIWMDKKREGVAG